MMSLRAIAPYVRRRVANAAARCELCGVAIAREHRHLVDTTERTLRCSCSACALLFQGPGQRYRAAPDRWLHDPAFTLDEQSWSALQIPVRLAFFFRHAAADRWTAFYPGPAGATESTLGLEAWQEFASAVPLAALVEPDVEALLVAGDREGRFDCYLMPISACYELVGRVKRCWRGFDGGELAWREIDDFFAGVRQRSEPAPCQP
ncbi:MAG: hypothetical protein JWN44_4555 [Myxococcales bacterium]|nr:hypothetical protein [Myxococcales bacterium]